MRRLLRACLWLAPLAVLGVAQAAVAGPRPSEFTAPTEGTTCGSYGTTVEFVESPAKAAEIAKKEGKLVFVLHVSGNFEDPRFT